MTPKHIRRTDRRNNVHNMTKGRDGLVTKSFAPQTRHSLDVVAIEVSAKQSMIENCSKDDYK